MAINYASQFAPKVAETFVRESLTDSACGTDYQFTGVKTLKVLTVDTVPLGDYQRSGVNRYGQPVELGDVAQELTMGEDKSFAMTIDKGNDMDQMNLKGAAEAMKREMTQVVVPYIDQYRLCRWCENAGVTVKLTVGSDDKLTEQIFDAVAEMDNAGVPLTDRTLFLPNRYYKNLALNKELLSVEKLGESVLEKGVVGQFAGMTVKRVPDTYMPEGVHFLIKWKNASADPVKLTEGKIHKDPPGISGNLLEGRVYQDSFVLRAKSGGVCIGVEEGKLAAAPTLKAVSGGFTATITGEDTKVYYTLDGSDPRYSATAREYPGEKVEAGSGVKVRAIALTRGKLPSEEASVSVA